MAAPIIAPSQRHANLNKLLLKENVTRVTHKHLLCAEQIEWPRPPKDVEEKILTKLSEKLKNLPNIFKSTKNPSQQNCSDKTKTRDQLEIGTSSVFRALEHETLSGVLVSGQATPAIAVNHLISMGREKGCPLLCLDQLAPSIAEATNSKCRPLSLGFKKLNAGEESDFAEIISLIKDNSPTYTMQTISKDTKGVAAENVPIMDTVTSKLNKFRPIMINEDSRKVILEEMQRVFTEGLMVSAKEDRMNKTKKKKKQKKKKKNLKDVFDKSYHCQFEIGKRTVTDILERGKLQVILVSEEIISVLMSELLPASMLYIAKEKQCPVLVLPGMLDLMKSLCGGCVSVLAFKKLSTLHPESKKCFQQLIELCLEASKTGEPVNLSQLKESTVIFPDLDGLAAEKEHKATESEAGKSKIFNQKKMSELQSSDEEDFSHLYVLKNECKELSEIRSSQKAEIENTKKEQTFSSDFISLSGTPTAQPSSKPEPSKKQKKNSPCKNSKREISKSETVSGGKFFYSGLDVSLSSSAPGTLSQTINLDNSKSSGDFIGFSISKTGDIIQTPQGDSPIPKQASLTMDKLGGSLHSNTEPLFTISRAGDSIKTSRRDISDTNSDQPSKTPLQSLEKSQGKSNTEEAVGTEQLQPPGTAKTESIDYLALAQTLSGPGSKKAVKRKAEREEGFISFAYTETNIKTMTSNPSKKRKKKKNKK